MIQHYLLVPTKVEKYFFNTYYPLHLHKNANIGINKIYQYISAT